MLRACTCTVFEFPQKAALVGDLSGTKRTIQVFGADGVPYERAFAALAQARLPAAPSGRRFLPPLPAAASGRVFAAVVQARLPAAPSGRAIRVGSSQVAGWLSERRRLLHT